MLIRLISVVLVASLASPAFAVALDTDNLNGENKDKQAFNLVPDPNVLYQPWSGVASPLSKDEIVPPPPPGPYISSALSDTNSQIPNDLMQGKTSAQQPSPLMRPDMQWPMKQFQPKMWMPEDGFNYAPEVKLPTPTVKRSPLYRRVPDISRGFVPPTTYRAPGSSAYYMNRPMNRPGNFMQPNWNRQQWNQPPRAWNNLDIPMSNYPRQQQQKKPQQPLAVPHK